MAIGTLKCKESEIGKIFAKRKLDVQRCLKREEKVVEKNCLKRYLVVSRMQRGRARKDNSFLSDELLP